MSTTNGKLTLTRASSRRWPIIILAMLAGHVLFIATAITLATRSRYDVIPDYYRHAVNWDIDRAARPATQPGR